jgi:hypothetical protein
LHCFDSVRIDVGHGKLSGPNLDEGCWFMAANDGNVTAQPESKRSSAEDDSTIVATINPRTNDGDRYQLVAVIAPESPDPLTQGARKVDAPVHE